MIFWADTPSSLGLWETPGLDLDASALFLSEREAWEQPPPNLSSPVFLAPAPVFPKYPLHKALTAQTALTVFAGRCLQAFPLNYI